MIGALLDLGILPEPVVRHGIRRLLRRRLAALAAGGPEAAQARSDDVLRRRAGGAVALATDASRRQHYEVPTRFFELVLGPRLKYSGAWWPPGVTTLAEAETAMLDLTLERAGVEDGHRVLDLGCGWGALTFRVLETRPRATVVALSHSATQRAHLLATAAARGLADRLEVVTQDVNAFAPPGTFDRVVSVEMFEHVADPAALLARVAATLRPGGAVFLHVFAHRTWAYAFEDRGPGDWMARHFFTGGWMPAHDSFTRLTGPLRPVASWWVDGTHYARTARAWVERLDAARAALVPVLEGAYGPGTARRWHARWRAFFLACEACFGWDRGAVWGVSHHLLAPTGAPPGGAPAAEGAPPAHG